MEREKKHSSQKGTAPQPEKEETAPLEGGTPTPEAVQMEVETDQEVNRLKEDLETTLKRSAEYFEGWQRERADFINYKKRTERDNGNLVQSITGNVIKRYLIIMDDLERALKVRPAEGSGAVWAEGIELILRKLQTILDQEGIKRIEAENMEFDPLKHEAISFEPNSDVESHHVIEVLEQGYMQGDRVLRPARVRVAQ